MITVRADPGRTDVIYFLATPHADCSSYTLEHVVWDISKFYMEVPFCNYFSQISEAPERGVSHRVSKPLASGEKRAKKTSMHSLEISQSTHAPNFIVNSESLCEKSRACALEYTYVR